MLIRVKLNKKGFTLIELLISMFIFTIVMLGLISGYIAEKRLMKRNIYRNMAIEISTEIINKLRNENFDTLKSVCSSLCNPETTSSECIETRSYRNITAKFGKSIQISMGDNPDLKNITVIICWKLYNKIYDYKIYSIIRKE